MKEERVRDMRPLRVLKSVFGGFFLFATVVWLIMAIVDRTPDLLISVTIGAVASFFLLRKTKKDKAYSAKKKAAARGVVTEQTECAPIDLSVAPVGDLVRGNTVVGDFVTIHTERTLDLPPEVAEGMRECYTLMQAARDFEIMKESFDLASSTTTMDVFCMRRDLAMCKAHTLLQAEQAGAKGMEQLNCHNACLAVLDSAQVLKERMLADYKLTALSQAEALKTDRGKLNRYIKVRTELEQAEPTFMFMDEYDDLVALVNGRIQSFGGAID